MKKRHGLIPPFLLRSNGLKKASRTNKKLTPKPLQKQSHSAQYSTPKKRKPQFLKKKKRKPQQWRGGVGGGGLGWRTG
jgi:hypothetical protein